MRYTKTQLRFLEREYKRMRIAQLTVAFNKRFHMEKSRTAIKSALTNNGFTCGREGLAKGEVKFIFNARQIAFIQHEYLTMAVVELTAALNKKFRAAFRVQQVKSFVHNHKINCGRTGRFEKGNVPFTAGTKGFVKPNSGNFKKGSEPANINPMYSERICARDGCMLIKVPEANPYTGAKSRYKHKHVWLWEQEHGPAPDGHVITFIDADKLNVVIENLMLVTRGELLYLNRHGYNETPPDHRPTVLAMARLECRRFTLEKGRIAA